MFEQQKSTTFCRYEDLAFLSKNIIWILFFLDFHLFTLQIILKNMYLFLHDTTCIQSTVISDFNNFFGNWFIHFQLITIQMFSVTKVRLFLYDFFLFWVVLFARTLFIIALQLKQIECVYTFTAYHSNSYHSIPNRSALYHRT